MRKISSYFAAEDLSSHCRKFLKEPMYFGIGFRDAFIFGGFKNIYKNWRLKIQMRRQPILSVGHYGISLKMAGVVSLGAGIYA